MAREEADREDLLRDATAYVQRIAGKIADPHDTPQTIFAGFRQDGAASFYFNADPVYHFNASGQLRRAYCDGYLLKAEHGRLVQMQRQRTEREVALARTELTAAEIETFLCRMGRDLGSLYTALAEQRFAIEGQVPPDVDVATPLATWLAAHREFEIAPSPHAGR